MATSKKSKNEKKVKAPAPAPKVNVPAPKVAPKSSHADDLHRWANSIEAGNNSAALVAEMRSAASNFGK